MIIRNKPLIHTPHITSLNTGYCEDVAKRRENKERKKNMESKEGKAYRTASGLLIVQHATYFWIQLRPTPPLVVAVAFSRTVSKCTLVLPLIPDSSAASRIYLQPMLKCGSSPLLSSAPSCLYSPPRLLCDIQAPFPCYTCHGYTPPSYYLPPDHRPLSLV